MGAYCPAPLGTPELLDVIDRDVLVPTVHAMKRGRRPFRGVLYAGIMVTNQGPRVLEFNCRFGDPETQPLLMRLRTDLLDLLEAVVDGPAGRVRREAAGVGPAAGGVRGAWPARAIRAITSEGQAITGLAEAARLPDVKVFHAGTRLRRRPRADRRRPRAGRDGAGRHAGRRQAAGLTRRWR